VLTSLGPAVAAGAGLVILSQPLTWTDALATGLVVTASIAAVRTGSPGAARVPSADAASAS
jgi:threonine/homoserine efflux transporter RhtA